MTYIREIEDDVMAAAITTARLDTDSYTQRDTSIGWFETNSTVWPTYRNITSTRYITSPPEYIGSYTTTTELFSRPYVPYVRATDFAPAEQRALIIGRTIAALQQYDLIDSGIPLFIVKNASNTEIHVATGNMLLRHMSLYITTISLGTTTPAVYVCLCCEPEQLQNSVFSSRAPVDDNEYWFHVSSTRPYDVRELNDLRTFFRSL